MISSLIRGFSYDAEKKQLTVRFSTSTYIYHNVPPELGKVADVFDSREAEDIFACRIEGKFRSTRETT